LKRLVGVIHTADNEFLADGYVMATGVLDNYEHFSLVGLSVHGGCSPAVGDGGVAADACRSFVPRVKTYAPWSKKFPSTRGKVRRNP
jgi:hypothetical protein